MYMYVDHLTRGLNFQFGIFRLTQPGDRIRDLPDTERMLYHEATTCRPWVGGGGVWNYKINGHYAGLGNTAGTYVNDYVEHYSSTIYGGIVADGNFEW